MTNQQEPADEAELLRLRMKYKYKYKYKYALQKQPEQDLATSYYGVDSALAQSNTPVTAQASPEPQEQAFTPPMTFKTPISDVTMAMMTKVV